jgi:two-component system sensor histidine kinase BaeS
VGAVVVTAGLTFGLLRVNGQSRALSDLRRDARRLERLAERLGANSAQVRCTRKPFPRVFGEDVRFVPVGEQPPALRGLAPEGRATIGGRDVIYTSVAAQFGACTGTLWVFAPASDAGSTPQGIVPRLLLAAGLALLVSVLVAYALAQRMVRPLQQLAHAARRLARGEHIFVPKGSEPQEVAELHDAFTDMSHDLAAAREREQSFLLSVSHELRTPLTAIRGYGEALQDGTARGAGKAGAVIVSESRRLERLVQDLIDLARLEAGEFSVHREEVDLAKLGRNVAEALRPKAQEADVRLDVRSNGPSRVSTDPDRAHQMLANLVENALRVTPAGGRIALTVDDRSVEVADSGPGLEADDVAHAFERFYLWRKYRGERACGTGLGLAIVGELARRLGVDVMIDSRPGAGTRFRLSFA